MKTKILSISAVVFGLLLLSIHHLGYSFGDDLFRWAGIPPWTDIGSKTGLHLPVVAAIVLLIFGIRGIVRIYQPVYPKILSRTLLTCAAFIFIFPFLSAQTLYLLKYNSTGISSVDYSTKDSRCSYQSEGKKVKAMCSLNIYNYGKEERINIRPLDIDSYTPVVYEPQSVSVSPRSQTLLGTVFYGELQEGSGVQGWSSAIGVEIEVGGVTKRYE